MTSLQAMMRLVEHMSAGANVTCPRDGRDGTAYCDAIDSCDVGKAQYMLSYTWGYTIGDIVESLSAYCEQNNLDQRRTFVWICCMCINRQ